MKKLLAVALAAGATIIAVAPADARQGCGPGYHRGPAGHCRPNRGGPAVVVAPGAPGGRQFLSRPRLLGWPPLLAAALSPPWRLALPLSFTR